MNESKLIKVFKVAVPVLTLAVSAITGWVTTEENKKLIEKEVKKYHENK